MVRQKDSGPPAAGRSSAIQRHRRFARLAHVPHRPVVPPAGLVARPAVPRTKHKTILEWTENVDKKRKLEIEVTTNITPNANFTFVPIGHPELTSLCKELSREQSALVYIVSNTEERGVILRDHTHRVGYQFRTRIVNEAISMVDLKLNPNIARDQPDPIRESQREINKQADAAIRDLYPRIPNTDREMIIRHAFQKGAVFNGKPVVGLQTELSMSRRVQLAVVAHIRHTHTRYDLLLRETSWENARKTVEPLCLDVLVKWRGDEETGRDQLDEILREIVVIDDSDEDNDSGSEDEDGDGDDSIDIIAEDAVASQKPGGTDAPSSATALMGTQQGQPGIIDRLTDVEMSEAVKRLPKLSGPASRTRSKIGTRQPSPHQKPSPEQKERKARRGKKRFQAWQDALNRRNRRPTGPRTPFEQASGSTVMDTKDFQGVIQDNYALEQNSSMAQNAAPPNPDYQSIYAIDGSRGPSRLNMRLASPRKVRLLERPQRDQDVLMSYKHESDSWKRSHDYDRHYSASDPYSHSRPQTSFSDGRGEIAKQDMALPSIESPAEVPGQDPGRVVSYRHPQYSKVRYQEFDDRRYPPPARSNLSYADGWEEESEAKRRRMVVANDSSLLPITTSSSDSYFRYVPTTKVEYPSVTAPSFRRSAEIKDVKVQFDIVAINENELNYPEDSRRVMTSTGRDNVIYTVDSRDHVGDNRERPFIIEDDSPPRVRVVRPLHTRTYFRDEQGPEPEIYKIHRAEDQEYYRQRSPALSSRASPQEDVKPVNRSQTARPPFLARTTPRYQQRVATEMSKQNSPFPSHSRSHEMNSGQTFHQFPTSSDEPASRFSSSRYQPMVMDSILSQLPHGRHPVDDPQNFRLQNGNELQRGPKFGEVSRMESRYISVDSQSRVLRVMPEYPPVDSRDRVILVGRQLPAGVSAVSRQPRITPYREEVIVLSD